MSPAIPSATTRPADASLGLDPGITDPVTTRSPGSCSIREEGQDGPTTRGRKRGEEHMWDEVDLVPGRTRGRARTNSRDLVELILLLVAALVAGLLPLFT